MKFQDLAIGLYFRAGIGYQKITETIGRSRAGVKKHFFPYDRVVRSGCPPLTVFADIPVGKLFTEITRKEVLRKEGESTASRKNGELLSLYPTDIVIGGARK
jgi:hypothetical protein